MIQTNGNELMLPFAERYAGPAGVAGLICKTYDILGTRVKASAYGRECWRVDRCPKSLVAADEIKRANEDGLVESCLCRCRIVALLAMYGIEVQDPVYCCVGIRLLAGVKVD
jgi:hypothetical protein